MKIVVFYILLITSVYAYILANLILGSIGISANLKIGLVCSLIGGLGGCMYCMRGIYLNRCVKNNWNKDWEVWYLLRPIVSFGSGAVSYLFLQAGLLVLESGTKPDSTQLGFYALAFTAGYNVDKFMNKIEEVAEAIWGIKKSNSANNNGDK